MEDEPQQRNNSSAGAAGARASPDDGPPKAGHIQHSHHQLWGLPAPPPGGGAERAPAQPAKSLATGPSWYTEALQSAVTNSVSQLELPQFPTQLHQWHESLRSEAKQRLGGFKPPLKITDGKVDDSWDLLKRVRGAPGGAARGTSGSPAPLISTPDAAAAAAAGAMGLFGGRAPPFLPLGFSSMKRSASETSLESMNSAAGAPPGGGGAPGSARKQSRHTQAAWAWEQAAVGASPWTPRFGDPNKEAYAQAHASAVQAMRCRPTTLGLLTSTEHNKHDGQDAGAAAGSAADAASGSYGVPPPPANHTYWAPPLHQSRVVHVPPLRAPAPGPFGASAAVAPHLGMPRVPTAPTFQELSETLNNSAHRNLEAVRAALQSAQAAVQETANNCQANLQTLTHMLQAAGGMGVPGSASGQLMAHGTAAATGPVRSGGGQNGNDGGGGQNGALANPLHAALSNSRAVVTWTISNAGDPLGGALVPWHQVIPRAVGQPGGLGAVDGGNGVAGPLAALPGQLGDGGEAPGGNLRGAMFDWVTPLEQYMNGLSAQAMARGPPALFDGSERAVRQLSVRDPGRQVAIVTTASLPWLTGTAVNPLLRAAYLSSDDTRRVTLVLPWLSPADQQRVFPTNMQFETPEQQEEYVRAWARQRTGLDCNFKVAFYPSRYAAEKGSILPVGDITQVIPDHEADVAVLEEPEHLNWYHHGTRWTDKFKHVVGVMHTNYLDYARREENGNLKEQILKHINAWVCRIHCHKVIKLSDAVQPLPREDTMFVHGVSPAFLKVGAAKARQAAVREQQLQLAAAPVPAAPTMATTTPRPAVAAAAPSPAAASPSGSHSTSLAKADAVAVAAPASTREPEPVFPKGVYFLGKVLWAKGYTELLDRLNEHVARTGEHVEVDVYGSGPDLKAVEEEASKRRLALHFNGARDHADKALQDYKVFINPSLSDVVATTTAEALAMGKWVVCADHPSNQFFKRFPNCLIYKDSEQFSQCLRHALHEDPRPLSEAQLHELTWEAATERFLDVADLSPGGSLVAPLEAGMDKVLHAFHNALTGVEFFRVAMGAGARTRDMPARVTDYTPDESDVGGFFDNTARAKKSWEGKKAAAAGGGAKKGAGGGKKADGVLPTVPEGTAVNA